MKYRLSEKIKYYEKRANDPRLTETQRDYAKGFVSATKSHKQFIKNSTPDFLSDCEDLQRIEINRTPRNAHQSGAKQGFLAIFNTVIHKTRD